MNRKFVYMAIVKSKAQKKEFEKEVSISAEVVFNHRNRMLHRKKPTTRCIVNISNRKKIKYMLIYNIYSLYIIHICKYKYI